MSINLCNFDKLMIYQTFISTELQNKELFFFHILLKQKLSTDAKLALIEVIYEQKEKW